MFSDYQSASQVAFKKGVGDPELQILKGLQLSKSYEKCLKFDIANAYDSVDKRMIAQMIE